MIKYKILFAKRPTMLFVLAASLALQACKSPALRQSAASAQLDKSEKAFVAIFDGKSTAGWHSYGRSTAGSVWEVVDGALHLNIAGKPASERGDLVTDEEYENYHLKLEWKISAKGNSGIIFNIHENPALYPATYNTGMEMQVLDNERHGDGKIPKHRTGDLYDLIASSSEPVKPVGEWNLAEIKLDQGKLDYYLNGVHILSTTLFNKDWEALVAQSKFRKMPGFGTFRKGKIALQDHDDEVWYRNIRIKGL